MAVLRIRRQTWARRWHWWGSPTGSPCSRATVFRRPRCLTELAPSACTTRSPWCASTKTRISLTDGGRSETWVSQPGRRHHRFAPHLPWGPRASSLHVGNEHCHGSYPQDARIIRDQLREELTRIAKHRLICSGQRLAVTEDKRNHLGRDDCC